MQTRENEVVLEENNSNNNKFDHHPGINMNIHNSKHISLNNGYIYINKFWLLNYFRCTTLESTSFNKSSLISSGILRNSESLSEFLPFPNTFSSPETLST